MGVPLDNIELGSGSFSIRIRDRERLQNVNRVDELFLTKALRLCGSSAENIFSMTDAIFDWRDPDDDVTGEGAESDYYLALPQPYRARNGPFDAISDLRYVRGIAPELVDSMAELLTTVLGPAVNINTASSRVLQACYAIDENIARALIQARAGPDGIEGTDDDAPFSSAGELMVRVPGLPLDAGLLHRYFSVRSTVFEVEVEAKIRGRTRLYTALVFGNGVTGRSISTRILYMNRALSE